MPKDEKAGLADKLYRLSQLTWAEIKQQGRHKLGFEKIARGAIKAGIPSHITEDVDHFLAFRFDDLKAMVGYRLDRHFLLYGLIESSTYTSTNKTHRQVGFLFSCMFLSVSSSASLNLSASC